MSGSALNSVTIPIPPTFSNNTLGEMVHARKKAILEGVKNSEKTAQEIYRNHQEYRKNCLKYLEKVLGKNYKNFIQLFDTPFSSKILGHRHILISYGLMFLSSFVFVGLASWALKDIFVGTAEMIVMFSLLSVVISFPKLIAWISPKEYKHLLEDLKNRVLEQDELADMQGVVEEFKNNPDYNYKEKFKSFKQKIDEKIIDLKGNPTQAKAMFKDLKTLCQNYDLLPIIKPKTKTEKIKKVLEIVLAVVLCLPFFLLFLEPKDEDKVREGVGNFFAISGPALFYILVNKIFNGTVNLENSLDLDTDEQLETKRKLVALEQELEQAKNYLKDIKNIVYQNNSDEKIQKLEKTIQKLEKTMQKLEEKIQKSEERKKNLKVQKTPSSNKVPMVYMINEKNPKTPNQKKTT